MIVDQLKIAVEDLTHRMRLHVVSVISLMVNSKKINQWSWHRAFMCTYPLSMVSDLLFIKILLSVGREILLLLKIAVEDLTHRICLNIALDMIVVALTSITS